MVRVVPPIALSPLPTPAASTAMICRVSAHDDPRADHRSPVAASNLLLGRAWLAVQRAAEVVPACAAAAGQARALSARAEYTLVTAPAVPGDG